MQKIKYTQNIVRNKLIKKKIILLSKYNGSRSAIKVKCKICKKKWSAAAQSIWIRGCKFCNKKKGNIKAGRSRAHTDREFKKILNKNLKAHEKYDTRHTPIKMECLICGDIRTRVPHHYFDGKHHCRVCGIKKMSQKLSYTNKMIDKLLKKAFQKRLSNYKTKRQPLHLECLICGHDWWRKTNISQIRGCPSCQNESIGNKLKLTKAEVDKILMKKSVQLLSKFNGTMFPGKLKCKICKHKWPLSRLTHILYITNGCPKCMVRLHDFYKSSYFKKHPEMKNVASNVYFINLKNKKENFYKIGITRKKWKIRFRAIPYKFKLIKFKQDTLYNCYLLEKKLKKEFIKYRYRPKVYFHGVAECFKFDNKTVSGVCQKFS